MDDASILQDTSLNGTAIDAVSDLCQISPNMTQRFPLSSDGNRMRMPVSLMDYLELTWAVSIFRMQYPGSARATQDVANRHH